jgi:hypothetical protein
VLKGSFKYTTYISDIDYTAYVTFNERFIEILTSKLKKLRDFKFIYLNAGTNIHFKLPWIINPEWGCDFDLVKAVNWFNIFKEKKLVPQDSINKIGSIMNKKKLLIGDLIDIQEILNQYNVIKWFLPDIEKGSKEVNGHTYILLDELKSDNGPVLNSIYIDGKNIVSVDIGLVDKKYKYKQPIWSRMYKYYTQNWYNILKSYKKLISKDYESEYRDVMKTMEYTNSILARTSLLDTLMKYRVVNKDAINYVASQLKIGLKSENIKTNNLKKIQKILQNKLDQISKPYVSYFLDKLTHHGKIKTYQRLRLTVISQIPTDDKKLKKRREKGIKCPFFKSNENETIDTIASKLLFDPKKFHICIRKISTDLQMQVDKFIEYVFKMSPVMRMFLQYNKGKNSIYIRGSFSNADHILFHRLGEKTGEYYTVNTKYLKRLQIYLITGY